MGRLVVERKTVVWDFRALRPGETSRTCARCGRNFVPAARNQKYCSAECRTGERPKNGDKEKAGRRKAARRKAERTVDSNLMTLNEALFRELERIESAEGEQLEIETRRADTICDLAGSIIANGRLVLAASQASLTTAETVAVPKMLLGGER